MNYCIALRPSPPARFRLWCNLIPAEFHELCRTQLIYKTSDLCRKAMQQASKSDTTSVQTLTAELQHLDAELRDFRQKHLAPCCASVEHQKLPYWSVGLLSEKGAPLSLHLFKSFLDNFGWIWFSTARIQVHRAIFTCLSRAPPIEDQTSRRRQSIDSIIKLVDDVHAAALAALTLDPADAAFMPCASQYILLPAASVILSTSGLILEDDPTQKAKCDWTRSLLLCIGQRHGVRNMMDLLSIFN